MSTLSSWTFDDTRIFYPDKRVKPASGYTYVACRGFPATRVAIDVTGVAVGWVDVDDLEHASAAAAVKDARPEKKD